jgi:uncharacterized membrane-anchored protein YhcB (DUF1043 family)
MIQLVGILAGVILAVLIVRLFGAWMLRIDVVIKELKQINEQLKNK